MKPIGYLVMDACEDWEQALALRHGDNLPDGGILQWRDKGAAATLFPSRAEARAAINRTSHYALAFGYKGMPEKRFCKIIPVRSQ